MGSSYVPIKGDASVYEKLDYLILGGSFKFPTEVKVKMVYFDTQNGIIQQGSNLKVDSLLIPPEHCDRALESGVTPKFLGLMYYEYYEPTEITVTASSLTWTVPSLSDTTIQVTATEQVGIILPYGAESDTGTPLTVKIEASDGEPFQALSLNISFNDGIVKSLLAQKQLHVVFDSKGIWAQKVQNSPKIVLEVADPKTIQIENKPTNVVITQASVADRTVNDDGGGKPGNDQDKGGLGAGPIAGIAVGAVAVVGIAAVCVWFFVLRRGDSGPEA
jgi:hypothetical protein